MVHATLHNQLLAHLNQLPLEQQRQVLDFARALASAPTPRGVAGRDLLPLAGSLSEEAAAEMVEAVEAGCEQVDAADW
jgi:hypothetical protein